MPSSPSLTCTVDSPSQMTSAKYGEMWFSAVARTSGSCAAVSIARHDPRLVPRMPIEVVALPGQPRDRAPGIEHRLAAHLRGPPDVRADDVVGAPELGRHARVVVGEAEAQRADAEPVEEPAQAHVALGIRVPLRQHDDRAPAPALRRFRKVPRADGVVLLVRRAHRAREGQPIPLEQVLVAGREREERLAVRDRLRRPRRQPFDFRLFAQADAVDPVQPPFEGTNEAMLRGGGQPPLPLVKDSRQHRIPNP